MTTNNSLYQNARNLVDAYYADDTTDDSQLERYAALHFISCWEDDDADGISSQVEDWDLKSDYDKTLLLFGTAIKEGVTCVSDMTSRSYQKDRFARRMPKTRTETQKFSRFLKSHM